MVLYEDDISEDFSYILFRLNKYNRKAEHWKSFYRDGNLTANEEKSIAMYNQRIISLLLELTREFSEARKAQAVEGEFSRTSIYDYAHEMDKVFKQRPDLKAIWNEIEIARKLAVKNSKKFSTFGMNNKVGRPKQKNLPKKKNNDLYEDVFFKCRIDPELKTIIADEVKKTNVLENNLSQWVISAVLHYLSLTNPVKFNQYY